MGSEFQTPRHAARALEHPGTGERLDLASLWAATGAASLADPAGWAQLLVNGWSRPRAVAGDQVPTAVYLQLVEFALQRIEGAAAEAVEQHDLTAELGYARHLPPEDVVAGLTQFLQEARTWLNQAGTTVTCVNGRGTIRDESLQDYPT